MRFSQNLLNLIFFFLRFFRKLVYCTRAEMSLHDMKSQLIVNEKTNQFQFTCVDPSLLAIPAPSLVVTRKLTAELGEQTFLPSRFLQGLIPAGLLNEYLFWQGEDDTVYGYEIPNRGTHRERTFIAIKLEKVRNGYLYGIDDLCL